MPIFVLLVSAGVTFDGAFSLWVSFDFVLSLNHFLVNMSTANIEKVALILFLSVEATPMNLRWHNFQFQPNINDETTLDHLHWIDVIHSTSPPLYPGPKLFFHVKSENRLEFIYWTIHPSKHLLVLKTSWRRLQHVFSVTIRRLPRRLEDVFKTSR